MASMQFKASASVVKLINYSPKGIKRIYSRASMVLPGLIGRTFEIHIGQRFRKRFLTSGMIGYKFGELADTRRHGIPKNIREKLKLKKIKKGSKK